MTRITNPSSPQHFDLKLQRVLILELEHSIGVVIFKDSKGILLLIIPTPLYLFLNEVSLNPKPLSDALFRINTPTYK